MTTPTPLPRLVQATDVARRMGETFTGTDTGRVEDYIESVTAVVLDEGLDAWSDVPTCPARVRVIVIDAVERRLNNPEQLTQRGIAGDMESTAADLVGGWLTRAELATVHRLAGKGGVGEGGAARVTSTRTPLAPERVAMLGRPWPGDYDGADDGDGYDAGYGAGYRFPL